MWKLFYHLEAPKALATEDKEMWSKELFGSQSLKGTKRFVQMLPGAPQHVCTRFFIQEI